MSRIDVRRLYVFEGGVPDTIHHHAGGTMSLARAQEFWPTAHVIYPDDPAYRRDDRGIGPPPTAPKPHTLFAE